MNDAKELMTVDAGSRPVYRFVEYDEWHVKLQSVEEPEQFVIIDKTALQIVASAMSDLAKDLDGEQ